MAELRGFEEFLDHRLPAALPSTDGVGDRVSLTAIDRLAWRQGTAYRVATVW
jgi:hypothetical protein